MSEIAWIARLPCGCVIDVCEECADVEALVVSLYHWRGNGYAVERVEDTASISLDCATCAAVPGPWETKRMFA